MTDIPHANIKTQSNFISAIWVIPIVAALIGGWMVFKSAVEKNLFAEVSFSTAAGLEAGKTVVKLRNVKVGSVTEVKFSKDLSKVVVVIEFTGIDKERLTDTTRFWVVKPRVGIEGVSGLDTLLSGAFIEIDPGEGGKPVTVFKGLEEPQIYQLGNPGTTFVLSANNLGSLIRGSPIKFRNIKVGSVTKYILVEDHSHVEIEIFIESPHDKYVTQASRFWNISGIDFELGAKGFKLGLDSISSLISGGVAFSNDKSPEGFEPAKEKHIFTLHDSEEPEVEEILTFGVPMRLYFDKGVKGLSKGAPVEFKGLRIGTVVDIGVESNKDQTDLLTFAMIDIEPERMPTNSKHPVMTRVQREKNVYAFFTSMVSKKMRAQLSSNFLTGQSLISFDFFPNEKPVAVKYNNGVFILPTVEETFSGILKQVDDIMLRVESMPIEQIGNNLNDTSASLKILIESLNASEGGMTGVQLSEIMGEIEKAARSIRSISEYLERHPEALIKGKSSN